MSSSAINSGQPSNLAEGWKLLILAVPLVVGQVSNFGMNFVDTLMAGRIGTVDLAAIAVGSSIWAAGFLFMLGVLMAVSATVSQLAGAGRYRHAGEFTRQALWVSLILAVGLWVLSRTGYLAMAYLGVEPSVTALATGYLKAIGWGAPALAGMLVLRFFSEGAGYTKPTMYIGVAGILANIPLNYVLMFGKAGFPAMGAVGAGWATAIVLWLQLIIMTVWIWRRPYYRAYAFYERFSLPNPREIFALFKLGVPIGIMVLLEGGLFVASALMIGTLGAVPVAGHQVAMNFASLIFMVPLGLAGAITVLVGQAVGREDWIGARRAGVVGIVIALLFACLSATLILTQSSPIVAIYTNEPEVVALAVSLLAYAAVFQLADGLQIAAAGALRGYKDTHIPMVYSAIAYWGVGFSVGWYLTFRTELGPAGMWIGIISGLCVAAVLMGGRFLRLSRVR